MEQMNKPLVAVLEIVCCPECLKNRKVKRFKRDSDVNRHLKQKHDAPYTIKIDKGVTLFIPRMRQRALVL
jgi:hypothetical protein